MQRNLILENGNLHQKLSTNNLLANMLVVTKTKRVSIENDALGIAYADIVIQFILYVKLRAKIEVI